MKMTAVFALTTALSIAVIYNAFRIKAQFYPAMVYLTKSGLAMAVLYTEGFALVLIFGKFFTWLFFGQLRPIEVEHLLEKMWFAVTETCLAFTMFRDDFSPGFVAAFTLFLFIKAFHWLVEDRIDFMESTNGITLKFHIRACSLLFTLGTADTLILISTLSSLRKSGTSVQVVFGFEYAILLLLLLSVLIKYILYTIDDRSTPWERKTTFFLVTELITSLVRMLLYLAFMGVLLRTITLPIFAVRPLYLSIRSFKKSLSDMILARKAISYINNNCPDARPEDLANQDNTCIICLHEMTSGKKLSCKHIFHTGCLKSWFQRQQSCPICRVDIIQHINNERARANPPPPTPDVRGPPNGIPANPFVFPMPNAHIQQPFGHPQVPLPGTPAPVMMTPPGPPLPPHVGAPNIGGQPWAFTFPPPPPFLQTLFPPASEPLPGSSTSGPTQAPSPGLPGFGLGMPPPLQSFFPMPFMPPPIFSTGVLAPAAKDLDLGDLTVEQLQAMEGEERRHLEARIKALRNIHTLLDAALTQYDSYSAILRMPNMSVQSSETLPVSPGSMASTSNSDHPV